ncbi:MAG: hypothetical protein ACLUG9_13080 [Paraclostridium sordellii]|uniref:Uncharacterized protein n=1 Tax=Paraclostridium sordellii TaxID=1505 RepID=A0A9P1L375_PARSO|nr:hypothetical protein [Paeniclostridium sordellii]MCH1964827.1 hypothetical protein [Paeniclostridium sordellii]MDU6114253.1 hypothetical protein [Paeniclostridium sordellii]MRZ81264.1 hypothetical protein [Paeniclostridium sordellii]MSB57351.1 hypothetical protein [Paeniclostridium sordellii]CEN76912.1 Uncharacterised protein [[Clostridium] sordellii] [Paeniclostridium sordellii]
MLNNILYINNYINDFERDFLENKSNRYVEICKKIYGANIDELSIHIWTSHIMNEFNERLIKKGSNINGIEKSSNQVYDMLKLYRKNMIVYSYLKGVIFGNNEYNLIKEFKIIYEKIMKEKSEINLRKKELKNFEEVESYLNSIKIKILDTQSMKTLNENIETFYLKKIEIDIKNTNLNCDIEKLINIIKELMINDAINQYNEGILDGIIHKINKKHCKNNKIVL